MNNTTIPANIQQHPSAVDAYLRHGWKLVAIPPGSKGPTTPAWEKIENTLQSEQSLPRYYGVGLCHAYSGTMALDIDSWNEATQNLSEHGIDLNALYQAPDAVIIDSGKPGHGKLLYRMPFSAALKTKRIMQDRKTLFEMRCASASGSTVQDVLPPTIHPETNQPYRWAGHGHWSRLPEIPAELLAFWQSLIDADDERVIGTPTQFNASWNEIQEALEHIHPDIHREDWLKVGMALHWAGHQTNQVEQAYHIWNAWSQGKSEQPATKYNQAHLNRDWKSFKPDGGISLGTFFEIAKKHGWRRKAPTAAELFENITLDSDDPADFLEMFRPPVPVPDLELFPAILTNRANEIAQSVGCDPLVPLFAGLATACGAVDARTRLELAPGFKVPPVLWIMTVADPADKKSPGSKPMMQVLRHIEKEDRPRYKQERMSWEALEKRHAEQRRDYVDYFAQPEMLRSTNEAQPEVTDLPPEPLPKRLVVSDTTSQKLVRLASERPHGLICWLDEMNAWINKVVDKKSLEDRSAWVQGYESDVYEMDRVGSDSIWCENLAVNIYGNVQPKVLHAAFRQMGTDGLLQRFVPVVLRPGMTRVGTPIPEAFSLETVWNNTIKDLHGRGHMTYRLSAESYQAFRDFQFWYESTKNEDRIIQASDIYMTAFGKLEGLTGRLCLMFHLLETATSNLVEVPLHITERAIQVVKGYIIPALRYSWGDLGGVIDDSFDHWIMNHILAKSGIEESLTLRDLKHSARKQLVNMPAWQKDQLIIDAMGLMESCKWVIRQDETHRKDHVVWFINPHLHTVYAKQRQQVLKIRQKRLDENRKIAMQAGRAVERRIVPGLDEFD